jgi:beta-glucosidase
MVLLKNEDNILPLKRSSKIALIGALAKEPRYQGSGSSQINPTRLEDISEELTRSAGANAQIAYAKGYELNGDATNEALVQEAVSQAAQSDVAIVFAGLPTRYESEGFDRKHLCIPDNQVALIEAIAAKQPNVVVVLSNGAPIEMPWLGSVKAVLEAYLGGQALGGAIADLLFGDVNPSGKLAETFPEQLSDNPSYLFFPGEGDKVEYREGLFVGYRYYDKKKLRPLFPFGYGLSYTTFEYSDLAVNKKQLTDQETLTVTMKVRNTGSVKGKEVIQLYVRDVQGSVIRPDKELKGFDKVQLAPGEQKTVTFTLDKRSFAYYDTDIHDWVVESGEFDILLGKSSQHIMLKETVTVESTFVRPISFHRNSTMLDLKRTEKGAAYVNQVISMLPFASSIGEEHKAMLHAFLEDMPLRGLLSFSGGKFTEEMLEQVLAQLNE